MSSDADEDSGDVSGLTFAVQLGLDVVLHFLAIVGGPTIEGAKGVPFIECCSSVLLGEYLDVANGVRFIFCWSISRDLAIPCAVVLDKHVTRRWKFI